MRLLSSQWLLAGLQASTLAGISNAEASPDKGMLVEFRIKKPRTDSMKRDANSHLGTVRSVALLADGGLSSLLEERSDESALGQIENIIGQYHQKRANTDDSKSCKTTPKCTYGRRWNEEKQQCEDCPSGQEVNKQGDQCVPKQTDEEKKAQGKCPEGQKLDPKVPGQDELTENPKCVPKDDTTCPEGQSMTTATQKKQAECAPDDEPDKKCDKPDTFDFKEVVDGKIKHSCRSTEEKEKRKQETVKESTKKVSEKYGKEAADEREKQRKIRARRGACLALGALTFIPESDTTQLSDDEIEGMQEPELDPDSPIPDKDLEDYMVHIYTLPTVQIEMETAGFPNFGALINAAEAAGKVASKAAQVFSKIGGKTGGKRFMDAKSLDKTTKASDNAINAAKGSETVKRILKSDTFQECLALGATLATTAAGVKRDDAKTTMKYQNGTQVMEIDLNAEKKDWKPSPADQADTAIVMVGDQNTDAQPDGEPNLIIQTFPDNYYRDNRLAYQDCGKAGSFDNSLTLIQVWGGCCKFYDGENCEPETGMFLMTNREDGQLDGAHDNAISSFWCTFDPNCAGAP